MEISTKKPQEASATPFSLAVAVDTVRQKQGSWVSVLDALRGAAALYVVCSHAAILMTIRFWDARAMHSLPLQALAVVMYLFAYGQQAVILFFVLSGFCIHFKQAQALHARPASEVCAQFQTRAYFARRWRRIVPPFYFALLFTAFVDWVTRLIYPDFLYHLTSNRLANQILIQNNTLPTLLGNIFFMQSLACPTYGNNTPLWSLACEFFLYALYPVFLKLRCTLGKRTTFIMIGSLSALIAIYLSAHPSPSFFLLPVLAYWFCWVLGAFAAEAYANKQVLPKPLRNIYALGFMAMVWLATIRLSPPILFSTFGAAFCALFILRVLNRFNKPIRSHRAETMMRALTHLGAFSYSLYLTHVPVLGLICTAWFMTHRSFPTNPMLFVVGVCVSVAVGWFAYWLVERRFISRR